MRPRTCMAGLGALAALASCPPSSRGPSPITPAPRRSLSERNKMTSPVVTCRPCWRPASCASRWPSRSCSPRASSSTRKASDWSLFRTALLCFWKSAKSCERVPTAWPRSSCPLLQSCCVSSSSRRRPLTLPWNIDSAWSTSPNLATICSWLPSNARRSSRAPPSVRPEPRASCASSACSRSTRSARLRRPESRSACLPWKTSLRPPMASPVRCSASASLRLSPSNWLET
mmetsp:Transcript_11948/g.36073  ORF Transcript_11948/g.36073 Transcript_11948/m.36073 type:complete len:230 (+) Transcript_11948:312-1001(+)